MFIHTYVIYGWYAPRHVADFPVMNRDKVNEIRRWCWEAFGSEGHNINTMQTRWKDCIDAGEIMFEREEDLAMFILRWA